MATDIGVAYIGAVLAYLPDLVVSPSHFRVAKMMNDRLTEVRHILHRKLQEKMSKSLLKGSRWVLQKNS